MPTGYVNVTFLGRRTDGTMRYEVSVKADYVPNWGIKEAFREFQSNAQDAERECFAKASTTYRNGTVYIENDDVVIPREALLFGHTTKHGHSQMIGQFGEGLKLACLAAVRAGYDVKIRSGSELWKPSMQESKVFPGTNVLTFDISSGKADRNRVVVEMAGISPELWDEFQRMFLTLQKTSDESCILTRHGSLLLDPNHKGRIYVKGVFVQHDCFLKYGYDLTSVSVDRDRKLIDRWDMQYAVKEIWCDAATKTPKLSQQFLDMLESQEGDVAHFDSYVSDEVATLVAARFAATHGDEAFPVLNLADAEDVGHLGRRGVVVSKAMHAIVTKKLGSIDKLRESLRTQVSKLYSLDELSDKQKRVLILALQRVGSVRPIDFADVDVVDFRSEHIEGLFKDGRIVLRSSLLDNFERTLQVMVHEVAHRKGGDGSAAHVAEIEDIWVGIFASLRKQICEQLQVA